MRLRADTWIHGTAAPMGCQVRRLRLPRLHCRSFRDVSLWVESIHRAHLLLAFPTGLAVTEPLYLVSNLDPTLDLVWTYGQRFCCKQLFRDQKSGIFQLESSGLRDPARIDRLLLVVAIAVLASSLRCTLAQDLEHQPARAPQQVDQAQDESGRHLPQRRRHQPAGGQSAAGATGGMAVGTPPLLLRGHHGQNPPARGAAGAHRW